MKRYYPVFLDLEGKRAAVVGDGEAARARAKALEDVGARVRVIAARDFTDGDLEGAAIAIALADRASNEAVRREADRARVPLGVVDDAELSDFIHGAVLRRGALVVAISTSGAAPALAVRLRDRLAAELGQEYARLLELAAEHREAIARSGLSFEERRALWYRIVDEALVALHEGDEQRARAAFAP